MAFSTDHIDALERADLWGQEVVDLGASPWTEPRADATHFLHLTARTRPGPVDPDEDEEVPAALEDVLIGLHALSRPFHFVVLADTDGVSLYLGTDRDGGGGSDVAALLAGACPGVDVEALDGEAAAALLSRLGQLPRAAVAVGTPTRKPTRHPQEGSQLDRLVRAAGRGPWAYVVSALPAPTADTALLARRTVNEMRVVAESQRSAGAESPIAEKYTRGLEALWSKLQDCKAKGGWHCGTFLLAETEEGVRRAAAAVRSVFSGDDSVPDPLSTCQADGIADRVAGLALPVAPPAPAPGLVGYPHHVLGLLSSDELAVLAQLPDQETPGFHVRRAARFDVSPHADPAGDAVSIGVVFDRGRPAGPRLVVTPKSLCRHALVVGTTGSGKTNTVFALLQEAARYGVPFLVLEPAKREYRGLDAGDDVRVFTLGREGVSPLRLNPLEVPPGMSVSEHVDLLRAAFAASFGLWTPLPQVLEQSLHAVYRDRGWDLARNVNRRLDAGADPSAASPTLTDLVAEVTRVADRLGYSGETTAEIRSALITRINALRVGGKGRMLDVRRSFPPELLFDAPTVIELEGLGADEDKAFVMALLLIRLAAHRRRQGPADGLRHLLVVEEAHRLLARTGPRLEERAADPQGKAVETFTNLLAEVRAYGQGIVIVDQVPTKLATDVLKNTNLKIAHRLVAEDDREVVGGSMVMDDDQERTLATLSVGEAAVFGSGDDASLLCRVPRVKDTGRAPPDDDAIRTRMAAARGALAGWADDLSACGPDCSGNEEACAAARRLVEGPGFRRAFARVVLSGIEDATAWPRTWPELLMPIRAEGPGHVPEADLLRCVLAQAARWWAGRRGDQAGWSYATTEHLEATLRATLLAHADPAADGVPPGTALRDEVRALCARAVDPYPLCARICTQQPPVCTYRHAVADLVEARTFDTAWRDAEAARATGTHPGRRPSWEVCMDAAYQLIEFPDPQWREALRERVGTAARRASLCFGQQMLVRDGRTLRAASVAMSAILEEAGHG